MKLDLTTGRWRMGFGAWNAWITRFFKKLEEEVRAYNTYILTKDETSGLYHAMSRYPIISSGLMCENSICFTRNSNTRLINLYLQPLWNYCLVPRIVLMMIVTAFFGIQEPDHFWISLLTLWPWSFSFVFDHLFALLEQFFPLLLQGIHIELDSIQIRRCQWVTSSYAFLSLPALILAFDFGIGFESEKLLILRNYNQASIDSMSHPRVSLWESLFGSIAYAP